MLNKKILVGVVLTAVFSITGMFIVLYLQRAALFEKKEETLVPKKQFYKRIMGAGDVEGILIKDIFKKILVGLNNLYETEDSSAVYNNLSATIKTLSPPIFVGFYYTGMPNNDYFQNLGMERIYLVDRNIAGDGPPDEAAVRKMVALAEQEGAKKPIISLDLEHRKFDIRTASTTDVDESIAYTVRLIDAAHDANPNSKVGVYGLPFRDYWTINNYYTAIRHQNKSWWKAKLREFSIKYIELLRANDYVRKRLVNKVDYVFPSLYTFYDTYNSNLATTTLHSWQTAAFGILAEARKYGKPVYPYLWPQFHNGGPHKDFAYLPKDYWSNEIRFARHYADGMLIWGSSLYRNDSWDEKAEWWQAVLQLARTITVL